jgi:hypothetical protein
MGDSILDFLSSNWASILGQPGPAGAGPTGAPPPGQGYGGGAPPALPPAAAMNNPGPFSPSGAVDGGALGPQPGPIPALGDAGTAPFSAAAVPPSGPGGSYGGGPIPPSPTPPPGGGPSLVTPANAAIPGPTGPTPSGPPGGQGYNGGMTDVGPGAPLNISPNFGLSGANPAALPPGGGAPPTSTTGSLARALGLLRQQQSQPNYWQSALAGVGRGLSAVGAQRPGASGAASFAAGMGGGLSGGIADQEAQKKQNFDQSSAAFKDMILAQHTDDAEAYNQARTKYFNARATGMMSGTGGSNAWQNTPYGKVIQVENEAQKYEKGQQIILQKRWALNGTSPEQQQEDLQNLQKTVDGYRNRLYKSAGVDPDKAAKLRDQGTAPNNPFDTKGMSLDQFHSQVPMGAWYKDQNGNVLQRTVPPPGAGASASPQQLSSDDYLASEPPAQIQAAA